MIATTETPGAGVNAPALPRTERRAKNREVHPSRKINVGQDERTASVAAGVALAALGLARRGTSGMLLATVGGALTHRGVTGHCYMYQAMGVDSAQESSIHVAEAFLINRSAEELYAFWRDFRNLPGFMMHLESVEVFDQRRSHWVANAPKIAGSKLEWDAVITQDEPDRLIAWRTIEGADVEHSGEIRFEPAMGDRGTAVRVHMDYKPPAGHLGHWFGKLSGQSADWKIRDDLRNFKRLMETGEIPAINGQPRGTCTGQGKRTQE
jgi:uncharacterized membrane protein